MIIISITDVITIAKHRNSIENQNIVMKNRRDNTDSVPPRESDIAIGPFTLILKRTAQSQ
jgi:hypothetical protein